MTIKNDLYIWVYKFGARRPKKITLKKFVNAVNDTTFSQKFFTSEKEVKEHIKNDRSFNNNWALFFSSLHNY